MYGNSVSSFLVALLVDTQFCLFFNLNINATAKENIYPPSVQATSKLRSHKLLKVCEFDITLNNS